MTQRDTILRLLREAGPKGVSAHVFNYEHGITRSAAVVHELRQDGHNIETIDEGKLPDGRARMARYVLHTLRSAPTEQVASETALSDGQGPLATLVLRPLLFKCGCVRSADGTDWLARCLLHPIEVARL